MKADLHVHSTYSDGSASIEETLNKAVENNITHISFVDHDTIEGTKLAQEIGSQLGLTVIPGIEISAYDFTNHRKVHVLGYMYDERATHIQELCRPLLEKRHNNSMWQVQQLINHGYQISLDVLNEKCKTSQVIYKQHIMAALTDLPFTDSEYQKTYKKLFKNDGICARDIMYVDAIDAVRAIKADNGFAVLAHPGQLNSFEIIPQLVEAGLDGIELNHLDHSEEHKHRVKKYAETYNLVLTGGSDYHGEFGAPIQIGDILCPSSFIEQLLE